MNISFQRTRCQTFTDNHWPVTQLHTKKGSHKKKKKERKGVILMTADVYRPACGDVKYTLNISLIEAGHRTLREDHRGKNTARVPAAHPATMSGWSQVRLKQGPVRGGAARAQPLSFTHLHCFMSSKKNAQVLSQQPCWGLVGETSQTGFPFHGWEDEVQSSPRLAQ